MIPQHHTLTLWPQGSRQPNPFLLGKHDTAKILIHGLGLAIQITHILVDHLEGLCKCAPRLACYAVAVARGVDVGSRLVNGRVDEKAGGVGRPTLVAAYDGARVVDEDHVFGFEQAKVLAEWVRPEGVGMLWVAD